ncbi:MAG: DUF4296 domain-containing protein [Salinivenus sp.]
MLSSVPFVRAGTTALALCAVVWFSGCSVVSSDRPPLPDSTFARMLVESHLMTARARQDEAFPAALPDSVFERYEVAPGDFDATLRYYSERPADFADLYDGVIDTLNAIQRRQSDRSLPDTAEAERADPRRSD